MNILDKVQRGKVAKPRRICVYGSHGVGKTTWASRFPDALVIATEDGSGDIDVARLSVDTALEVLQATNEASSSEFKTIIIDSIDWFEKFVEDALHAEGFQQDFGKGTVEVARRIGKLFEQLDLCISAGKTVILIAHEETKKVESVSGASWDRVQPKLSKKACGRLLEWADEVLHAEIETFVSSKDEGFGRERGIATTSGRRILKSDSHPSYVSKRRIALADKIDMNDPVDCFLNSTTK